MTAFKLILSDEKLRLINNSCFAYKADRGQHLEVLGT